MYPRTLLPAARLPDRALALLLLLYLLAALPASPPLPFPAAPDVPPAGPPPDAASALGRVPLAFVPNAGQSDPRVSFQAQVLGGTAAFSASGVTLALPDGSGERPAVVRLGFVGARPDTAVEGRERRPGLVNLYLGDDPAQWRAGLPTYAALVYRGLYPGVDLRYDGAGARLKGTYELAPGADPARIRWRYEGGARAQLDPASGDLLIALAGLPRTLVERAPVAWQEIDGRRRDVPVRYAVAEDGSVGFALGGYDPALPLTIDPTLEYSSYLGGAGADRPASIAVDAEGNLILTGTTASYDFPTAPDSPPAPGRTDTNMFVTKLNSAGTELIFSTLFGGTADDTGNAAALDSSGRVVVVGDTLSGDLPVPQGIYRRPGGGQDAFAAVFGGSGALEFASYFGGSGFESGQDVAVDGAGALVVVGATESADLPLVGPLQPVRAGLRDWFIAKIRPDRAGLVFSTYYGGAKLDEATGVAVGPGGEIRVVGITESPGLATPAAFHPALAGESDALVIGLASDGAALRFATYLGGTDADLAEDIALDAQGNLFLVGWTIATDFPVGAGAPQPARAGGWDAFVASLVPDGAALRWSTYLGGTGDDHAYSIAVAGDGTVAVAGATSSADLPSAEPGLSSYRGGYDAFVSALRPDGSAIDYSIYHGGSADDRGFQVAFGPQSTLLLAGATRSADLPLAGPLQLYPGAPGTDDGFLARITSQPRLRLSAEAARKEAPPCATPEVCAASTLPFTVTVEAADGPVPADLVVQIPEGLNVLPSSLTGGASYDRASRQIYLSATVAPGAPRIVTYRAILSAGVLPGAVLNTSALAHGPDHSAIASVPVVVAERAFSGTLVLIYASGDNDLADEMQELLANVARGSTNPAVLTLLLLDGPDDNDTVLYRFGCRNLAVSAACVGVARWAWPGDQLANVQNLDAFLTGALRAYPNASRRVLSLVGHGGGWSPPVLEGQPSGHGGQPGSDGLGGMLWDENPRSALSTPELGRALRGTKEKTGLTFDLLFLDACSMAMAEVAYEVRGSAHFLLASPSWKWAGFPYHLHIPSAVGDGRAIGLSWLRQEATYLRRWPEPFTYTLLDLGQMQPLRAATDTLAEALLRPGGPLASAEGRGLLLAASAAADRYDSNSDGAIRVGSGRADADHYVDLGDLAVRLAQTFGALDPTVAQAARDVSAAVGRATVASEVRSGVPWKFPDQVWSWSPSASLAIYLPLHHDDWRQRYYSLIQYSADGRWDELIARYWQSPLPPAIQRGPEGWEEGAGRLSPQHILPPDPICGAECGLPFAQLALKSLSYLPIVAR